MSDKVKIYIGTDRSQLLAAKVLEYSIRRTASKEIHVETLEKLQIPQPNDLRQTQRTGFSFVRWALPELCNYQGRAIYLDADMLVFQDILYLWEILMNNAVISIVDGTDNSYCSDGVKLNKNETSVMVIDCEKVRWNLKELVQGLDGQYTYSQMMSDLCFLKESEIIRNIPRKWNSMDYWDDKVSLVHFTNIPTQPWVSIKNKYGHIWIDYLKNLVKKSVISINDVEREVELEYCRPSLLVELAFDTCYNPLSAYAQKLQKIDEEKNFLPHREVEEWNRKRSKSIRSYEMNLAKEKGRVYYCIYLFKKYVGNAYNRLKLIINDKILNIQ